MDFRTVPDTNVLIAANKGGETSPNREYLERWRLEQFALLYSRDTVAEYVEKLQVLGASPADIKNLLADIVAFGDYIEIRNFHFREYPADPDDIAFLLCADNGNATHLISYDPHLLHMKTRFAFRICKTLDFLHALRADQGRPA